MEYMKDYPSEFAKPLEICFQLLERCNIDIFDDDITPLKKYLQYLVMILCVTVHYVSLAMFTVNVIMESREVIDFSATVPFIMVASQGKKCLVFKKIDAPYTGRLGRWQLCMEKHLLVIPMLLPE